MINTFYPSFLISHSPEYLLKKSVEGEREKGTLESEKESWQWKQNSECHGAMSQPTQHLETRKDREVDSSLEPAGGTQPCWPIFSFDLWNRKVMHLCYFSHSVCGSLLQLQCETNAHKFSHLHLMTLEGRYCYHTMEEENGTQLCKDSTMQSNKYWRLDLKK